MIKKNIIVAFIFICTFVNAEREDIFFDFEKDTDIWEITDLKSNAVKTLSLSSENFLDGSSSLKVGFKFPKEGCIEKDFFKNLLRYKNIVVNIYTPENAPEDLRVCVLLQDNEWLWYQTQIFSLPADRWNRLTLNVQPESPFWESIGHNQPWSEKSSSGIRKIGMKFFSDSDMKISLYIDMLMGEAFTFPDYSFNSKVLKKYERFEISFQIPEKIENPFDSEEIKIDGIFTDPEGNVSHIPGFYYQKYERKMEEGTEILMPVGYPVWKIRFTPVKTGIYRYYVKITVRGKDIFSKESKFTVSDSENPGFLRVNRFDNKYFAFENGDFFYPVGLNIRSPTDTRYARMVGQKTDMDSGTYYYEEMFSEMHKNGLNFVEIWMAPWFTSLEWIENRPGYRGLGYYNLKHAWKLDRLLEMAEKNDIYIQIVIINHGQLSTWCDQEWQDNPYNIKKGGFLSSPDEFFSDKRAKESFKNQLRYIIGRWSYSTSIFSWNIINEMNLIGLKNNFYRDSAKVVAEWYQEITGYISKTDSFDHLISAHYTILVDNQITSKIIDYTITNAYYNVAKNESLIGLLAKIIDFNKRFDKPSFVAEYGGTPMGGTVNNLKRDIITGLWYSYHQPFAAAPLFWWHRIVKDKGLFPLYKNFTDYTSDIDKTSDVFKTGEVKLEGPAHKQFSTAAFGNKYFTSCWIYNSDVLKNIEEQTFQETNEMELTIADKKPGSYTVEFYDMEKGMLSKKEIVTESVTLNIKLPSFSKWLALKVKPVNQISP